MKLALKELAYYKLKYLMITFILFLLSFLVLFVSSLAQGLARDNTSLIDNIGAPYYVVSKDADHQLSQSQLSKADQALLRNHDIELLSMKMTQMKNNVTLAIVQGNIKPNLTAGHMPQRDNEIAVDNHLDGKLKIGDTVTENGGSIHYKVTGFVSDEMYAHTPVGFVTKAGYQKINSSETASAGILKAKQTLNLHDAEVITQDAVKKGIPSFEAEQLPLMLMVVFLFVISAIVIASFFYVITIQKTSEYGILKAIGISNSKISRLIIAQVFTITIIGTGLAVVITLAIGENVPVTMPFYLNSGNIMLLAALYLIVGLLGALMSLIKVIKIDPKLALGGE